MQFKLVQILHLFRNRGLAFDDRFSGRIFHNQSIIHGIHDSPFQLMVEVHRGLTLVAYGIIVQKLLIGHSGNLTEFQSRSEFFYPRKGHFVLIQCNRANCTLFVYSNPLLIIIAEQVVFIHFV